ncbi:DUF3604 domain-containing protein [Solimonas sp. SE-A11]|uniref:DUF3604 domain-containing protein n=1 Tax=Solimonas sp. SE-A11 TaxID=3054954 RepID=UPI00259C9C71|nr:DUF3604 domain-containing protein [Solimonas sp. SE-A11]MDM4772295.1 DUF3604 domain-containing protein [Solimonas sp. SE-A11]
MMRRLLCLGLLLALTACGRSDEPAGSGNPPPASAKCRHYNDQRQPFFGDLHVHTKYSLDANTQGTVIGPHEAYRFAQGEELGIQPYNAEGQPLRTTRLSRPLDFAAVTDHAELFGETEICTNPELEGYNSLECRFYRAAPPQAFVVFNLLGPGLFGLPSGDGEKIPRLPFCGLGGERCIEAAKTPWRDMQLAAEAYLDRSAECRFTTFVGYEWTGAPLSNNLHRNVLFESEVVPEIPPSYLETPEPELLWEALAEQCRSDQGCNVLTIPHNSNLAGGLMFRGKDRRGRNFTEEYAQARQFNEPLAEIYQHKGQSECLGTTGAGLADEQCGFELIPYRNFIGSQISPAASGAPLERDYLRDALKEGLRYEQTIGANPFKYGFVGSSDTHLGTPGRVQEQDYPGHGGAGASARDDLPPGLTDRIENSPGGLAVLWAEENTRSSLFSAMRRREAYATSGTRPVVRFYGGWNLPDGLCGSRNFAAEGYRTGVPMGGDLPALPASGLKPRFAVSALRDPGASGEKVEPLQHIQIVKGWIANGEKHEAVYEIAGNKDNGASVNTDTCETSGEGYASLCSVWEDPDFDPSQNAFYYARVLENPSCRWSTRQCVAAGISCADPDAVPEAFADCCNADYPKTVQERAWTSPIWYKPAP